MRGGEHTGRTELKYLVSLPSVRLITSRLSAILPFDTHAGRDGSYLIRSLYFDDPLFRSYHDKEAGIRERKKFRIRYYNQDPSYIRLEEKEKIGDQSIKRGVRIPIEDAERLASGIEPDGPADDPLSDDFFRRIRTGAVQPVLFTDYYRTAFCHPVGDLRISLDRSISASRYTGSLWEPGGSIPLMKEFQAVLEIKFSGCFPSYVTELLWDIPMTPSAASKYCMCCEALY